MAGTVFGRLSMEEGDSANSLEGLDIKMGTEGKYTSPYLVGVWAMQDASSLALFCHILGKMQASRAEVEMLLIIVKLQLSRTQSAYKLFCSGLVSASCNCLWHTGSNFQSLMMTGRDRLAPEAASDVEESKVAPCKERKKNNNQEQIQKVVVQHVSLSLPQLTVRSLRLYLVWEQNRFEEKGRKG